MKLLVLILNRFFWLFPTVLGLLVITFTISHIIPADPVAFVAGDNATADTSVAQHETLQSIERYVVDGVIENFQRQAPELVLIDVRPRKSYFAETPFDYLPYFLADPRFARIWSHYEQDEPPVDEIRAGLWTPVRLLAARAEVCRQIARLDKRVLALARDNTQCRRFMSVTGVLRPGKTFWHLFTKAWRGRR